MIKYEFQATLKLNNKATPVDQANKITGSLYAKNKATGPDKTPV